MKIEITGPIELQSHLFEYLRAQRAALASEPIEVVIDTTGGNFARALQFGQWLRRADSTAIVRNAMSAGTYIAACCRRVVADPEASLLFHAVNLPHEDADDPVVQEVLREANATLAEALAAKSRLPLASCEELLSRGDWRLTGREAYQIGLVDQLTE